MKLLAGLAALLLTAPLAAAASPLDDFQPLLNSATGTAGAVLATGQAVAGMASGFAQGLAGPAAGLTQPIFGALGSGQIPGLHREFLATGQGSVRSTTSGRLGSCAAMQAFFEWHQPYSSEAPLAYNFAGGQSSDASNSLSCPTGWRGTVQPADVQGDPEHGIVVHARYLDANIDVLLSAPDAHGARLLWVKQVTYPSGIGDVLEFTGTVTGL